MKKPKKESKIVYLDYIDWQYEVGEAAGGNTVYGSEADLIKNSPCVSSCGIVRCKITQDSIVLYSDFSKRDKSRSEADTMREMYAIRLAYHEEKIKEYQKRLKDLENV